MRMCVVSRSKFTTNSEGKRVAESISESAMFHQWGLQSCEDSAGNMIDTVAIVEHQDGTVHNYYPNQIKFLTKPE